MTLASLGCAGPTRRLAPDIVLLHRTVYFTAPDGDLVPAGEGSYRLQVAGDQSLSLTPTDGGESKTVMAVAHRLDGKVEVARALDLPADVPHRPRGARSSTRIVPT